MKISRRTVDLSTYPDLVVVYLGMPVRTLTGLKTLLRFGPKIAKSAKGPAGRLAPARSLPLVPISAAWWHSPVLARF
jgi:hypothetical protein